MLQNFQMKTFSLQSVFISPPSISHSNWLFNSACSGHIQWDHHARNCLKTTYLYSNNRVVTIIAAVRQKLITLAQMKFLSCWQTDEIKQMHQLAFINILSKHPHTYKTFIIPFFIEICDMHNKEILQKRHLKQTWHTTMRKQYIF